MSKSRGYFVSPIILFLGVLTMFELCVRLPYVLYVRFSPELGYTISLHFFSANSPDAVIFIGLTILLVTAGMCLFLAVKSGLFYKFQNLKVPRLHIPWIIYPISLVFIGAAFLSIFLLGVTNVLDNLSGKRSEAGESFLLYICVKMANFCHVIAIIFYVKNLQKSSLIDRGLFLLATIALILPTIVFSQRAILIGFALELLYIQMIFKVFNLRGIFRIILTIIPVLLIISFLRPGNSAADFTFFEALAASLEKVVSSRYFFDFTKLGTVTLWFMATPWLGPVSLNFLVEPFFPDSVYFYKEIGPIISDEAYHYRNKNGVTPGALMEGILSFGILGGILFFGLLFFFFIKTERRLLMKKKTTSTFEFFLMLLILSKFSLLVNSSLGAFVFQTVLEAAFLSAVFLTIGFWKIITGTQMRTVS